MITAEATVKFSLEDINKSHSHYHTRILDTIHHRIIQERYTDASVMLQFLHYSSSRLAKKSEVSTFCYTLLSRIQGGKGIQEEEYSPNEKVSVAPDSTNPSEAIPDNNDMPLARAIVDRKKIDRDLDPDHHLIIYRRSRSRSFNLNVMLL